MKKIQRETSVYELSLPDAEVLSSALNHGLDDKVEDLTYREASTLYWLDHEARRSVDNAQGLSVPEEALGDRLVGHIAKRLERYAAHLTVSPQVDLELGSEIESDFAARLASEFRAHVAPELSDPFHPAIDLL